MKPSLTQEELKKVLHYDPETGIFRWRYSVAYWCKPWDVAGTLRNTGHIRISVNRKNYYAHRLAWLYMTGEWPKSQLDHINRIRHDNRFVNLREATSEQNRANMSLPKTNTTGCAGVWKDKAGKFVAACGHQGKRVYLGYFESFEEAAKTYKEFVKMNKGEYAPQ